MQLYILFFIEYVISSTRTPSFLCHKFTSMYNILYFGIIFHAITLFFCYPHVGAKNIQVRFRSFYRHYSIASSYCQVSRNALSEMATISKIYFSEKCCSVEIIYSDWFKNLELPNRYEIYFRTKKMFKKNNNNILLPFFPFFQFHLYYQIVYFEVLVKERKISKYIG